MLTATSAATHHHAPALMQHKNNTTVSQSNLFIGYGYFMTTIYLYYASVFSGGYSECFLLNQFNLIGIFRKCFKIYLVEI